MEQHLRSPISAPPLNTSFLCRPQCCPSPARSDCETLTFGSDPLGFEAFSTACNPHNMVARSSLLPPSPHPSEPWTPAMTSSTSSIMPDALAGRWQPDLFEPQMPVPQSPIQWSHDMSFPASSTSVEPLHTPAPSDSYPPNHRLSVSSYSTSSAYSTEASETVYPANLKLENPEDWSNGHPLTISPYHLTSMHTPAYTPAYPSPHMKQESPHDQGIGLGISTSRTSKRRRNPQPKVQVQQDDDQPGKRRGRTYSTAQNAVHHCPLCDKWFQRAYNYRKHREIHNSNRAYPHKCLYADCNKRFVRRTDLARHEQCVS
jgi:hypothetical protein